MHPGRHSWLSSGMVVFSSANFSQVRNLMHGVNILGSSQTSGTLTVVDIIVVHCVVLIGRTLVFNVDPDADTENIGVPVVAVDTVVT